MVRDNAGNRAVYRSGEGVLEQGMQFVITEKGAVEETEAMIDTDNVMETPADAQDGSDVDSDEAVFDTDVAP